MNGADYRQQQANEEEQQFMESGMIDVYKKIAKVSAALASEGISKSRSNQQQGYKFRGIDDVYNALAPILAENQLVILPRVLSREVTERTTAKGGVLFYVVVEVEFEIIAASDGSRHTVKTYGEAMDSADKATNKAMSAAYKYAAMQTFCIPTEGDNDADAHTHEIMPSISQEKIMDLLSVMDAAESMEQLKQVFASAWKESKGDATIKSHYEKLKGKFQ